MGSTFTEIRTIRRRLAWLLHKDDVEIHEAFHLFKSPIKKKNNNKKGMGKTESKKAYLKTEGKKVYLSIYITWTILVAHMVKNLPAMWETWI